MKGNKMFDDVLVDGYYTYTDNSGHERKYPSFNKLNKSCNYCSVALNEETICLGNLRKNIYICRDCDKIRSKVKGHQSLVRKYKEVIKRDIIPSGYIYVISSKSFPNFIKIGMSEEVDKRVIAANCWTPFKDFYSHGQIFCLNKRKVETEVHKRLKQFRCSSREWFKDLSPEYALDTIRKIIKEI